VKAIEDYLSWYLSESAGHGRDRTPTEKLETRPVPLARFLMGQVDERGLLEREDLDPTKPDLVPTQLDDVHERLGECHFVFAEVLLARCRRSEALAHLRKASGLPARNPMSWVVARQLTGSGEL
jgi:hypothetical protein